ncbi:hypothetical protein E2P81_ATG05079 [Venturia nashicola]|uniref:Uncharacterized protein n=1 Tax=Venturia nashicola TaxID=86259 RepID=A0A4Z1P246_9PEZI|nr:hypothetical protein E6O75_ATG05205 [Venturia nashicola]TLD34914.1 hypothetical protein E2P81_ATG05079 [Venturia nashicola]
MQEVNRLRDSLTAETYKVLERDESIRGKDRRVLDLEGQVKFTHDQLEKEKDMHTKTRKNMQSSVNSQVLNIPLALNALPCPWI